MILTTLTTLIVTQNSFYRATPLISLLPTFEKEMGNRKMMLGHLSYDLGANVNQKYSKNGEIDYTFYRDGNVNNPVTIHTRIYLDRKISIADTLSQCQAIYKPFKMSLPGCDNVDVVYNNGSGGLIAYMPYCTTFFGVDRLSKKTPSGALTSTYKWTNAELDEQFIDLASIYCVEMNKKFASIKANGSSLRCYYNRKMR
jgi:hypothetical protein